MQLLTPEQRQKKAAWLAAQATAERLKQELYDATTICYVAIVEEGGHGDVFALSREFKLVFGDITIACNFLSWPNVFEVAICNERDDYEDCQIEDASKPFECDPVEMMNQFDTGFIFKVTSTREAAEAWLAHKKTKPWFRKFSVLPTESKIPSE